MRHAIVVVLLATVIAAGCGHDSRGGRYLVYTRDNAVWIAHVDGTHARQLVTNAGYALLSPDGRWVLFDRCLASKRACESGPAPSAVLLIPSSGGKSRLLARSIEYVVWSPRSDRIAAVKDEHTLVSIDLAGSATVLDRGDTAPGDFSPDGSRLVYAKRRPHTRCGSDLMVVRLADGEKRRLTRGRDRSPVWGSHWIAFARETPRCSFAPRIWRVRPDGSGLQAVTGAPPAGDKWGRLYGFYPLRWTPDERQLLAGLVNEWGDEAIRLDVATGRFEKLGAYALDLSRDGRVALLTSGGAECPFTITSYTLATGRRQVLAKGCISDAEWNR